MSRLRAGAAGAALTLLAGLLGGCAGSAARAPQAARVLYAGSLIELFEHSVGPAFRKADHLGYTGVAGGSTELANEIKSHVRAADVFVSAAPAADRVLMGPGGGDWVSWYASFAQAPLVLAVNPASRFAALLRSEPWYDVVTRPGFRLGRTDPRLDPKGILTVRALRAAAARHPQEARALSGLLASSAGVFPEEELVGRLSTGQLDAGFFYSNEAGQLRLPTVRLGLGLAAHFTVTVLNRAPDPGAAAAFVAFLLGPRGRALLTAQGLEVQPPVVTGSVPPALRGVLGVR